jgi:purine-binding chemotaxis protein CheW
LTKLHYNPRILCQGFFSNKKKIKISSPYSTQGIDTMKETKQTSQSKISEHMQLISFTIAGVDYAIEFQKVKEVIKPYEIIAVPEAPKHISGIITHNGSVLPIVNLRYVFGNSSAKKTESTRMILVEMHKNIFGILADNVQEILRVPQSDLQTPPETTKGIPPEYISSVGMFEDRLLIMLDLAKIIRDQEQKQIEIRVKTTLDKVTKKGHVDNIKQ